MKESVDISKMFQLSGSMVEGATMVRCFQKNEDWREIEMDIMFNLFTIPQEVSHLLESVQDKPGFVRLPFCRELCSGFYNDSIIKLRGDKKVPLYLDRMPHYISPLVIKDISTLEGFMSRVMPCSESKTETTIEQIFSTKPFVHTSIDYVPAVRLQFWPHQAANWITRCRLWPPQDTIQSIVDKGCQVVPRSSPGGDVHSEWRRSFSGPEGMIAQLRTTEQQQAYYFFKMFFYRYLKCVEPTEPEGKPLFSYIIKTTMLWACEELPPEDPIWASLEKSVQMLLFKLLGSLETGFLTHYFIPEINLLERVSQDVRVKCVAIISRWQSNILMTAPFDMPEKREFINNVRVGFSTAHAIVSHLMPALIPTGIKLPM